MPASEADSQHKQIPPPLQTEKDTTEVYWPCAPDGYIPNSVVRGFVRPRRPPPRLIARMKRPELKKEEIIKEGEEDDKEEKRIIKGKYIVNVSSSLYLPVEMFWRKTFALCVQFDLDDRVYTILMVIRDKGNAK